MVFPDVQQFINANPALVIVALFAVGIIVVLSMRILLANAGCLVRLGCAILVVAVVILFLRLLFVR